MTAIILVSFLVYLASFSQNSCEGYRILGVFPLNLRSHFMMHEAMMKGLARKGHQVDVVSVFPQKRPYPNYTDIIELPHIVPKLVNRMSYKKFKRIVSLDQMMFIIENCGNSACEYLANPAMLKLLRDSHSPPYDIVITEAFSASCFIALGHHFKVPVIGLSASSLYPWGHRMIANPPNYAFVPNVHFDYNAPLTFWQRLHNTVFSVYHIIIFLIYTSPQDGIIKKYFGEDAPTVREVERSLALVMMNTHPSLNGPKPITPALIEVGGLHVQDDDLEAPQDLKEWMDNSTAGFVYFTFGSMVTIESFPKKIIQIIYKSLGKIAPIRVLIKIPNPKILPPGLPDNFRTFVWAPQLKVLRHKNIKAFITHGGLLSTQEAIHYAVPMIGMPLFADQFINIGRYTEMNIALKLDPESMTEETLDEALKKILHNPLYKDSMNKVSAKFLDRPMSSMDTAVWWVEYIARHGSNVLRSPAMDLTWWQIELLDVYAFIVLITILTVILVIKLLKFLINILGIIKGLKVRNSKKVQ